MRTCDIPNFPITAYHLAYSTTNRIQLCGVYGEITTRSLYAHCTVRDIQFLEEKGKEVERGVKGMDRISPAMCLSDTLVTWIG